MEFPVRGWLVAVIFFIPVLISGCAGCGAPEKTGPAAGRDGTVAETIPAAVDLTLTRFKIEETQGSVVKFRLEADRALQYQSGEVPLEGLVVFLFTDNKPSLELRAARGRMNRATKDIHLEGDVVATGLVNPVNFFTDSLDWHNAKELLTTDARVRIEREGMVMTGTGLIADATLQQLELQHDIRGEMR